MDRKEIACCISWRATQEEVKILRGCSEGPWGGRLCLSLAFVVGILGFYILTMDIGAWLDARALGGGYQPSEWTGLGILLLIEAVLLYGQGRMMTLLAKGMRREGPATRQCTKNAVACSLKGRANELRRPDGE